MTNKEIYEMFMPFANMWYNNITELMTAGFRRKLTEEESATFYKQLNQVYEITANDRGVILRDFVEEFQTAEGEVAVRKTNPALVKDIVDEINRITKELWQLPAFIDFQKQEWVKNLPRAKDDPNSLFDKYHRGEIEFVMPPYKPTTEINNSQPHLDKSSDLEIAYQSLNLVRDSYTSFGGLRETIKYKSQPRKKPVIKQY